MQNILNITNGDRAVEIMQAANIPGVFLPWRDVLHDGPVPKNLSLETLSNVRAQFIVRCNWGTSENIENSFIERDNKLKSFAKYEQVILWFEHDLYDQLQILQILDWFHLNSTNNVALSIICTSKYLDWLSPDEMKSLPKYKIPITDAHLTLSSEAWTAFRSDTPEQWYELLNRDTFALPFLRNAVIRVLEEYPSYLNGLSRTAQQALKIISEGEKCPGKVFTRSQVLEDRIFLGDASFWLILQALLESNPPLLSLSSGKKLILPITSDQELTITPIGREVLAGDRNWLEVIELDHWIGGVHLSVGNIWCWNSDSTSLVRMI